MYNISISSNGGRRNVNLAREVLGFLQRDESSIELTFRWED